MTVNPGFVDLICPQSNPVDGLDDNRKAKQALQALFQRKVPEESRQLRELWEKEHTLNLILKMDGVRDRDGRPHG